MAQHDYDIANQSGANFRTDLNNALDAIVSNNSGSSEPSTKFAYEWWIDTTNNLLKLRNSANNAWITLPLSITADNATSGALTVNGNLSTTGTLDVNGGELILDADADTSITADTDDQIDFRIGAVDVATLTNSHLVLKGTTPKITIGDGGAEDTALIFDGNAQDYYIGLDDSADDLIIGKGSTVGTTPAVVIDENLNVGIGAAPTLGALHVTSATTDIVTFENTDAGTTGAQLLLYHNSSSPADGDRVGALAFQGEDDGGNQTTYGGIRCLAADVSNGSEDGTLTFSTTRAGSFTEAMRIDSSGKLGFNFTAPAALIDIKSGGSTSTPLRVLASSTTTSDYNDLWAVAEISGHGRMAIFDASQNQDILLDTNGTSSFAGALSKGSGSFKIDHPLESKKDTHHLYHSFIEGPSVDNLYRGTVTLNNGIATINLDAVSNMTEGTFVALNREVQCYTTNETDWDAVKGNVEGNILTISCQNTSSSATVSWLVIGERQDKNIYSSTITDENGKLIVETLKPEQGE